MQKLFLTKVTLTTLSFLSIPTFAKNEKSEYYSVNGSHSVNIPININYLDANEFSTEKLTGVKTIKLMSIIPTQEFIAKNKLAREEMDAAGGEIDYSKGIAPFKKSATSVDLGMANVPVLDQGAHGTCVTFATTAAIDALLNQADFIDQQCNLALNKALGNDYWDGADAPSQMIDPIKMYGIVSKNHCFGSKYPNVNQKVTPLLYKTKSTKIKIIIN